MHEGELSNRKITGKGKGGGVGSYFVLLYETCGWREAGGGRVGRITGCIFPCQKFSSRKKKKKGEKK